MTTNDIIHDKTVIGTEKVDVSKKAVVDSTVKTQSKPFDVTAKDKTKMEAEKVVLGAKKIDVEITEKARLDQTSHSKDHAGIDAEKMEKAQAPSNKTRENSGFGARVVEKDPLAKNAKADEKIMPHMDKNKDVIGVGKELEKKANLGAEKKNSGVDSEKTQVKSAEETKHQSGTVKDRS